MPYHIRGLTFGLNLPPAEQKELGGIVANALKLFLKHDFSMLEINPLAVLKDGRMVALDGKMNFDDNALYRQTEIEGLRDFDEEDLREVQASMFGLSYIGLTGNIACLVNGAGLAMATMDIIKLFGGDPANFLDVGGGASQQTVTAAFKILLGDTNVKAIFVNIFGGIMRCDLIANGVVAAAKELGLKVPAVVRLEGTNVDEGKRIISESGLHIVSANDMADGAKKVVELARR
jgi:succinyl-CoA synthetase beta subunit